MVESVQKIHEKPRPPKIVPSGGPEASEFIRHLFQRNPEIPFIKIRKFQQRPGFHAALLAILLKCISTFHTFRPRHKACNVLMQLHRYFNHART